MQKRVRGSYRQKFKIPRQTRFCRRKKLARQSNTSTSDDDPLHQCQPDNVLNTPTLPLAASGDMSSELEFSDVDAGHEIEAETSDVPLLNAEDQTTAPAATQTLLHQGRRQVYKSGGGGGGGGGGAWMEGSHAGFFLA